MTETTRLHITPLTPDILPSVLPASIRNLATDISFHEISTFPENNYGYVTLPKMDAEKIKKKLNGSILKGKKFKVEAARPQKRHREEEEVVVVETPSSTKKKSKKSKKQEPEDGVLDGFELPTDRKVKRGWTESSDAKQERRKSEKKEKKNKEKKLQTKSKYTDKSECLFRATIPPNRASDAASDDKKAKKKSPKDNVVHEFAKTVTQPSFLRTAEESVAPTATFEDGKGWVDSTGNLREPANEKISKDNYQPGQIPGAKEKRRAVKHATEKTKRARKEKTPEESSDSDDYTSSSGSSSDESSESDNEPESDLDEEKVDESSEASSSSASSDEEDGAKPQLQEETAKSKKATGSDADADSDAETPSQLDSDEITTETVPKVEQGSSSAAKELHPLEALFKRPAPTAPDAQAAPEPEAGFSFFGNDLESEDEVQMAEPQTPFTPFTKTDLQNRGQRSAAPTPDTTAATRHMTWNESDDSDEDISIDTPVTKSRLENGTNPEETEFAKWFWENRGENNRAWKKRRRDAAKEQRQRDNRKKGLKGKS